MSKHIATKGGQTGTRPLSQKAEPAHSFAVPPTGQNRGPSSEVAETPKRPGRCTCPSHEQIAHRAFQYWESLGKPEGTDKELWLRAERELREEAGGSSAR